MSAPISEANNIQISQKGPEISLTRKVIKGGAWVLSIRIAGEVLALVKTIILARLLVPADFGLLGVALLTMSIFYTFSQTGIGQALVQKRGDISEYLNVAWTVNLLRNTIIALCLFFSAPFAAHFFNNPQVTPVLRALSLAPFLLGFNNPKMIFAQREFEFNKQFICEVAALIVEVLVAITLAFLWRNVWALVLALIAGNGTRLLFSYIVYTYKPAFHFDHQKTRELFGFGKWIFISSILIFLVTQGNDIFVGKVLGLTMLGFYQMAYKISNLPTTQIAHVISQVTFPAYSKLQNRTDQLRTAYLRVLRKTSLLVFPIAALILLFASDFTSLFLGAKWMPMVPALQVLALAGLVRSIAATTGPIFHGVGKPRIDTIWQGVRFFVMAALIYPCVIRFDIMGASFAVLTGIFIATIGFCYETLKIIKCSFFDFCKHILVPALNATAMASIIVAIRLIIPNPLISFVVSSFVGIILYGILTFFVDVDVANAARVFIRHVKKLIYSLRKRWAIVRS